MKKILIINGPNLNLLGKRDKNHYGSLSLDSINEELITIAQKHKVELEFFQSNHEGDLIDFIQKQRERASGILINPGALTHYGYSLRDALIDADSPVVEVHLSDIKSREDYRKISVVEDVAVKTISGLKERSYYDGLKFLISYIHENEKNK